MAAAVPTTELKLDPKYDNYDFPTVSPTAQSGHPGHTTPEQDAQVSQLRMSLEQAGHTKNLDTLTLVCLLRVGREGERPPVAKHFTAAIPSRAKVQRRPCQADVRIYKAFG